MEMHPSVKSLLRSFTFATCDSLLRALGCVCLVTPPLLGFLLNGLPLQRDRTHKGHHVYAQVTKPSATIHEGYSNGFKSVPVCMNC